MKKLIQNKKIHYVVVIAAVAFGVYAFFFAPTAGEAVSTVSIGDVKGTLHYHPSSLGTEFFVIEYNSDIGVGSIDISGWSVSNESGVVYTFGSKVLNNGESLRICADSSLDTCNDEWGNEGVWDNSGGTFTLTESGGTTAFSVTYTGQGPGSSVVSSKSYSKPVYEKNDKITLCHIDQKGNYVTKAAQTGPFVRSEEDGKKGHHQDAGDVIPAFYYDLGEGISFNDGLNWPEMKSVFDNGCK